MLFSDLVGFVPIARSLGAARTVAMLNHLVRSFDRLAAEHGVEKIKTIGDAYMAVAGVPRPAPDDAARLARMALADAGGGRRDRRREFGADASPPHRHRLGPVMAGVIGTERFSYDVWGDAVNLAARLENTGEPGKIQVSRVPRCARRKIRFHPARRDNGRSRVSGEEETHRIPSARPDSRRRPPRTPPLVVGTALRELTGSGLASANLLS